MPCNLHINHTLGAKEHNIVCAIKIAQVRNWGHFVCFRLCVTHVWLLIGTQCLQHHMIECMYVAQAVECPCGVIVSV